MIRQWIAKYAIKRAKDDQREGFFMYCFYGPGTIGRAKGDLFFAYARLWAKIARAMGREVPGEYSCSVEAGDD